MTKTFCLALKPWCISMEQSFSHKNRMVSPVLSAESSHWIMLSPLSHPGILQKNFKCACQNYFKENNNS